MTDINSLNAAIRTRKDTFLFAAGIADRVLTEYQARNNPEERAAVEAAETIRNLILFEAHKS